MAVTQVQRARYRGTVKTKALAIADEFGPAEASRRTGVPAGTISAWRNRERSTGADLVRVSPAIIEAVSRVDEDLSWADNVEAEGQAFGVVAREFREAARELLRNGRPTDAKAAILGSAIAADKAQLLTGQATSRSESRTVLSAEVGERLAGVMASVRQGNGLGVRRDLASDQRRYLPAEGETVVDA